MVSINNTHRELHALFFLMFLFLVHVRHLFAKTISDIYKNVHLFLFSFFVFLRSLSSPFLILLTQLSFSLVTSSIWHFIPMHHLGSSLFCTVHCGSVFKNSHSFLEQNDVLVSGSSMSCYVRVLRVNFVILSFFF